MSSSTLDQSKLPLRAIPGDYGIPFFGAIKDRYDYFYNQGEEEFFKTRIAKYNSTIFRTNMPPGPFISSNSKVVAVLDSNSFPILFDTSKVEKRNVLDGTYMPSTKFFGGYRVCAFLDPSEHMHRALKSYCMNFIFSSRDKVIPYLRASLSEMFVKLEDDISDVLQTDFNAHSDDMAFEFFFRFFTNIYPSETKLISDGPKITSTWLALQLAPIMSLGLKYGPNFVDDLIHIFRLPFFVTKPGYQKFYDAVYNSATSLLDEAEKTGISREEACHNIVFLIGFSAFGGMKVVFPSLIKCIGSAGESLHRKLANEVRSVVKHTFSARFKVVTSYFKYEVTTLNLAEKSASKPIT